MPAISCHKCRKLISNKDSHCPFCGAPQTIERETTSLTKEFFNEPGEVITWLVGINVLLYAASILLDSSEALSMKTWYSRIRVSHKPVVISTRHDRRKCVDLRSLVDRPHRIVSAWFDSPYLFQSLLA